MKPGRGFRVWRRSNARHGVIHRSSYPCRDSDRPLTLSQHPNPARTPVNGAVTDPVGWVGLILVSILPHFFFGGVPRHSLGCRFSASVRQDRDKEREEGIAISSPSLPSHGSSLASPRRFGMLGSPNGHRRPSYPRPIDRPSRCQGFPASC